MPTVHRDSNAGTPSDSRPTGNESFSEAVLEALHRKDGTEIVEPLYADSSVDAASRCIKEWLRNNDQFHNPHLEEARQQFLDWLCLKHSYSYDPAFGVRVARELFVAQYLGGEGETDEQAGAWAVILNEYVAKKSHLPGWEQHPVLRPKNDSDQKLREHITQMSDARYGTVLLMPILEWMFEDADAQTSGLLVEVHRRIRQDINEHAHKMRFARERNYKHRVRDAGDDVEKLLRVVNVFRSEQYLYRPAVTRAEESTPEPEADHEPVMIRDGEDEQIEEDVRKGDRCTPHARESAARNSRKRRRQETNRPEQFAPLPNLPQASGFSPTPGHRRSNASSRNSRTTEEHGRQFHPASRSRATELRMQPIMRRRFPRSPNLSGLPAFEPPEMDLSYLDLEIKANVRVLSVSLEVAHAKAQQHTHSQELCVTAEFECLGELRTLVGDLAEHLESAEVENRARRQGCD